MESTKHQSRVAPTLDEVFSFTADAVFALDDEGRIVFGNSAFASLFRQPLVAVQRRPCHEVVCGRSLAGERLCRPQCDVVRSLQHGDPVENFDIVLCHVDGGVTWANAGGIRAPSAWYPATAVIALRPITLYQVAARVAHSATQHSGAAPPCASKRLTRRERQVFDLLVEGRNARVIAQQLHVSYATARNHIRNIFAKLGVHSRAEAVHHAYRNGLVR